MPRTLIPTTDVFHLDGESVFVTGWKTDSEAPKHADARFAAHDAICCHAVLPNRFSAESLCLAYRSSIDAAVYDTLKHDGRFQHGCVWLADEAYQWAMIAIWRHAPRSLDRQITPECIGPDGSDIGPDLTDVASAYYRHLVMRELRKRRNAEKNRRDRERKAAKTYVRGQCRLRPDDDELKPYQVRLPRGAWIPVAPPVIENEEDRCLKAEEAVNSACRDDLDRQIIALKEQGDLSDAEIGAIVGRSGSQVNRAWHGVLDRAEETLGLDGDRGEYRKCRRRKRRGDAPRRRDRVPFWSVAWVSFHGNRAPNDPMPDSTGLFDAAGFKLGPLPRC